MLHARNGVPLPNVGEKALEVFGKGCQSGHIKGTKWLLLRAYVAAFFCRRWAARCALMRGVQAACAAAAGGRDAETDGGAFCKVIVLQNDTKNKLLSLNNAIFCKNCG